MCIHMPCTHAARANQQYSNFAEKLNFEPNTDEWLLHEVVESNYGFGCCSDHKYIACSLTVLCMYIYVYTYVDICRYICIYTYICMHIDTKCQYSYCDPGETYPAEPRQSSSSSRAIDDVFG